METLVSRALAGQTRSPENLVDEFAPDVAGKLIAASADVALVLDAKGVIEDIAYRSDELERDGCNAWVGRPWIDTVTTESRPKIEEMIAEARNDRSPRWRQVNHASPRGGDLPVRYAAVQAPGNDRTIVIGHDMRIVAALQQRLVEAQLSLEHEYARLRQVETRYRVLFQLSSEAVLIVDASRQKVVEANPAADELLGVLSDRLIGRPLLELFDEMGASAVQSLLATARSMGRAEDIRTSLAGERREFLVSASLFRQENAAQFLVRLTPVDALGSALPSTESNLLRVVKEFPDGFVVTGLDGKIVVANPAFLDLAELASEEQARGEPIGRWLGRSGVDTNLLVSSLNDQGVARNFNTLLRGEFGATEEVEVSGVAVRDGEMPCLGFAIRRIRRKPAAAAEAGTAVMPRTVEQLSELVGRVPLKDLVRETSDIVEQLCIDAALKLTGDNRASAAEMLGLSRQSLYSKLRRYGIGAQGPSSGR